MLLCGVFKVGQAAVHAPQRNGDADEDDEGHTGYDVGLAASVEEAFEAVEAFMEHHEIDPMTMVEMAVDMLDTDGSGAVSHQEAMDFINHMGWDIPEEDVAAFGAHLDKDGDMEVSAEEIGMWLKHEWEKMHGECDHHEGGDDE